MALFLVVALGSSAPLLDLSINASSTPDKVYRIETGKWIVDSDATTSKEFSERLGPSAIYTYIVVPVRGYFGRAQPDLWEWLAAKAAKANG